MTSAPASTMPGARRGVLLGDWGHFGEVLAEIDASGGALSLVGSATDEASASVLLRDARPDFAIVSARPDRIPGLVALAARSGCHVVSEKPLALDIAALRSLFAAVAKSGVRVCPMLSNRTRPALAAAVAAIRAGVIGRPVLLSARKTYKWGASRPAWFGDRAAYGGTIPWIGIHALDFIDAATDGDPVAEVAAFHANLAHPALPGCEDACALALRLRSGALATATLDYLRPESPVPHGDDGLRVAGERGELTVDIDRGRAVLLESGAAPRELPLPAPEPFYAPWILALPPRGVPAPPDNRTLRAFRLSSEALAAREAADSGRPVRLPFPETFW